MLEILSTILGSLDKKVILPSSAHPSIFKRTQVRDLCCMYAIITFIRRWVKSESRNSSGYDTHRLGAPIFNIVAHYKPERAASWRVVKLYLAVDMMKERPNTVHKTREYGYISLNVFLHCSTSNTRNTFYWHFVQFILVVTGLHCPGQHFQQCPAPFCLKIEQRGFTFCLWMGLCRLNYRTYSCIRCSQVHMPIHL